jgi:uroporphyrinogen decarboxylase
MSLTHKERVIEQIVHHETDILPYTIGGFEGDVGERLDTYYGTVEWRAALDPAIRHLPIPSQGLSMGSGDLTDEGRYFTDLYGTVWRTDLRPHGLEEPALKEPSLDNLTLPDIEDCFEDAWEPWARALIEDNRDYFLVAGFGFGLFERSWTVRGFENAMMDMAAHPDFYDALIEALADHQMAIIEQLLTLPVDGIMFSDDWGYQRGVLMGPERWRQILKPRLARLYDRVHESGKYVLTHCCGSIVDILPDLIEIGLDVYESVQPEAEGNAPYILKRKFGDHLTFWGGLGSQSTIPFGTPETIRAEIDRLCREMGKGGGYILGPAKGFQPETPTENAAAVIEGFLAQSGVNLKAIL